jgi:hypothetical protein
MTLFRIRCSRCPDVPVRALCNISLAQAQATLCTSCGGPVEVIGHGAPPAEPSASEAPAESPAVIKPPGIEFIPITERTNAIAKTLIESVFGKEV